MTDPATTAAMERLRTCTATSDQAMNRGETRRLTVVLPLPEVERLRAHLQPGESMADLLRRVLQDAQKARWYLDRLINKLEVGP